MQGKYHVISETYVETMREASLTVSHDEIICIISASLPSVQVLILTKFLTEAKTHHLYLTLALELKRVFDELAAAEKTGISPEEKRRLEEQAAEKGLQALFKVRRGLNPLRWHASLIEYPNSKLGG